MDTLVSPTDLQRFNFGVCNHTQQCTAFVSFSAWRNLGKVYFFLVTPSIHQTPNQSSPKHRADIPIIHYCFRFLITLCIWQWHSHLHVGCRKKPPKFCVFCHLKIIGCSFTKFAWQRFFWRPSHLTWQNFTSVSYRRAEILEGRKKKRSDSKIEDRSDDAMRLRTNKFYPTSVAIIFPSLGRGRWDEPRTRSRSQHDLMMISTSQLSDRSQQVRLRYSRRLDQIRHRTDAACLTMMSAWCTRAWDTTTLSTDSNLTSNISTTLTMTLSLAE